MGRLCFLIACTLLGFGAALAPVTGHGGHVSTRTPFGLATSDLDAGLVVLLLAAAGCVCAAGIGKRQAESDTHADDVSPAALPPGLIVVLGLGLSALLGPLPLAASAALALCSRAPVPPGWKRGAGQALAATAAVVLGGTCAMAWTAGDAPLASMLRALGEAPARVTPTQPVMLAALLPPALAAFALGAIDRDEDGSTEATFAGIGFVALLTFAATALLVWDRPWRMRWGGHVDFAQQATALVVVFGLVRLLVASADHPARAKMAPLWACASLLPVVLQFELTDSFTLTWPLLIAALVIGRRDKGAPVGRKHRVFGRLRPATPSRDGVTRPRHPPGR